MTAGRLFTVSKDSISLRVKAKPGARQDAVLGVHGGELVVAVRAVAEKGRANDEITKVLARHLGVPRDGVVIKLGGASPHKVVQLPLAAAAVLMKLEGGS
jgi:uncharacterized protein